MDALKFEIRKDQTVSHVFIPRRDRLERPDDAAQGLELENELRSSGITLVYIKEILSPPIRGRHQDLGEALSAYIDSDQSEKFRDDLAEKMIFAQLQLSKQGYSAGGRAPFGFRRNLISDSEIVIRQLADGEFSGRKVITSSGCLLQKRNSI